MFGLNKGRLLDVRRRFIQSSGRFDLVNDPPTEDRPDNCEDDSGADFFINLGQRILDGLQEHPDANRSYLNDTAVGDSTMLLEGIRSVERVWRMDADGKVPLVYKPFLWMHETYGDAVADIDQDAPLYWTELSKQSPNQMDTAVSSFANDFGDILSATEDLGGIFFLPPADGVYTIRVDGRWWSKFLTKNEDKSWWTVHRQDILVQGALAAVEMHYRNTQGVLDYLHPVTGTLTILLKPLDHDLARRDTARVGRRIRG